jgi:hypothetical protein
VKAELLPQLEQLMQQVLTLKNGLHDEEEQHDVEVAIVRREANVQGGEEVDLYISAKPMNDRMMTSYEVTYRCTHPMFDHHESSCSAQPNPWASIAECHTRNSWTQTRHLHTKFFCKLSTLSLYIIPSRHRHSFQISVATAIAGVFANFANKIDKMTEKLEDVDKAKS